MARILLIDDDPVFAEALREQLQQQGHEVRWVDCAEEGLRLLSAANPFDLVLLDNKMPRMSGLEFLAALIERSAAVPPVILMTSAPNDHTAIQATHLGAFAYIIKPVHLDEILDELGPEIDNALTIIKPPPPVPIPNGKNSEDASQLIGQSKQMREVFKRIGLSLRTELPVLILGETGTGKDLVARAIHTNSSRKNKPFVVIDCTALNENLLTDALFGHEPGAFTGADKLRKGKFEHAHGGTLFLDELGEMPAALQAMLLRVLENREIVRVGGNDPIRVDVRVLAATHRDLKALVREGKFRQDLYYRLEGMTIPLPPLRERKEDIELLARRFLSQLFGGSSSAPMLHPQALNALQDHPWPGNIRQLQKVLCRAVGMARGAQILPQDLDFGEPEPCPSPSPPEPASEEGARAGLRQAIAWAWNSQQRDLWPMLLQQLECELLRYALAQGMNQVKLAQHLGIARNTLRARLKQYGLEEPVDAG